MNLRAIYIMSISFTLAGVCTICTYVSLPYYFNVIFQTFAFAVVCYACGTLRIDPAIQKLLLTRPTCEFTTLTDPVTGETTRQKTVVQYVVREIDPAGNFIAETECETGGEEGTGGSC